MAAPTVRRADFLMALAYGTDLATGHSRDFALRSCVLAMRMADAARLDDAMRRAIYQRRRLFPPRPRTRHQTSRHAAASAEGQRVLREGDRHPPPRLLRPHHHQRRAPRPTGSSQLRSPLPRQATPRPRHATARRRQAPATMPAAQRHPHPCYPNPRGSPSSVRLCCPRTRLALGGFAGCMSGRTEFLRPTGGIVAAQNA
jgi:hypothetical protein